jgi:two-component system phosphate regulon response regulator PhoB
MEKKKILIIDDEADLVTLYTKFLEAHNYEVISALEAKEGIILAAQKMPDLILLDIKMPGVGGLFAYKDIRYAERTATIPIILISALSKEAIEALAREIKAEGYVHKTCEPAELLSKIKEVLKE